MEQSRQAQMNNYKAFGRRPGNRNLTVEKAKDKKGTLKRLIAYFAAEKAMIIGLLAAVIVVVICSVYAPKLQSNAIDIIASGRFKELTPILITMVVVYIIHSICTFLQTKISAVLSQNIVKKMREDLFRHIVNLPVRYLDSNSHGDINNSFAIVKFDVLRRINDYWNSYNDDCIMSTACTVIVRYCNSYSDCN